MPRRVCATSMLNRRRKSHRRNQKGRLHRRPHRHRSTKRTVPHVPSCECRTQTQEFNNIDPQGAKARCAARPDPEPPPVTRSRCATRRRAALTSTALSERKVWCRRRFARWCRRRSRSARTSSASSSTRGHRQPRRGAADQVLRTRGSRPMLSASTAAAGGPQGMIGPC